MRLLSKIKNRLAKLLLPHEYLDTYYMRAKLYQKFLSDKIDFDSVTSIIESNAFFKPNDLTVKNTPDSSNILIFSPHQDDDIIGCGGTILNSVKDNKNIQGVYVMDGVSPKFKGEERTELIQIRNLEAIEVWKTINDNEPIFLGVPTRSDTTDTDYYIDLIKSILLNFKPDCIFVPYPLESPLDHRRTTFLIWESMRQIPGLNVNEIWSYQVNTMISPNVAVDITEIEPLKFALMGLWKSQNVLFNYQHRTRGMNAANSVYVMNQLPHSEPYIELFHVTTPKNFVELLSPYYQNSNLF